MPRKTEAISLKDKFFSFVKNTDKNICWEWIGNKLTQGYGRMHHHSTTENRAHRISFIIHNKKIPNNLQILHKCNNRGCVNPDHLYAGTHKDNMKDLSNTGTLCGENNPASKLTEKNIIIIRNEYKSGTENTYTLAKKFNVSQLLISRIITGESWKHVGGPLKKKTEIIRLTIPEIKKIRTMSFHGTSTAKLAGIFNRHQSTIERIVYGISHKQISGPIKGKNYE